MCVCVCEVPGLCDSHFPVPLLMSWMGKPALTQSKLDAMFVYARVIENKQMKTHFNWMNRHFFYFLSSVKWYRPRHLNAFHPQVSIVWTEVQWLSSPVNKWDDGWHMCCPCSISRVSLLQRSPCPPQPHVLHCEAGGLHHRCHSRTEHRCILWC